MPFWIFRARAWKQSSFVFFRYRARPRFSATDHLLLLPFYYQAEGNPHILRRLREERGLVRARCRVCLNTYSLPGATAYRQTGARAYFLVLLHLLARHFKSAEELAEKFASSRRKPEGLRKLFEYIGQQYSTRISLSQAATIAGLSKQRFNAVFKRPRHDAHRVFERRSVSPRRPDSSPNDHPSQTLPAALDSRIRVISTDVSASISEGPALFSNDLRGRSIHSGSRFGGCSRRSRSQTPE